MNTWSKVAEEEKEIETEGKTREGGGLAECVNNSVIKHVTSSLETYINNHQINRHLFILHL